MDLGKSVHTVRRGRRRRRIDRLVRVAIAPLLAPTLVARHGGSVCFRRFEPVRTRLGDQEIQTFVNGCCP